MKKLVLFATIFAAVAFTACNAKTEDATVVETEEVAAPVEEVTEEAPATEEATEEVTIEVTEAAAE